MARASKPSSPPNRRDVLDTMARVQPDLVLMDLHMPGLSGTELTALIRLHEAFLHTPIVFLTGDPDPEKQFEVLECGADDFLQKPIRPRHLVAAIESRVKRARALGQQRMTESSRHPATGLLARPHLLQPARRLRCRMHARRRVLPRDRRRRHACANAIGYAALECLMTEAGRRLGDLAGRNPAARLNDNAFLVFTPEPRTNRNWMTQARVLARRLRPAAVRHRRRHPAAARDGGLRRAAPWLHRCRRRARSGGTGRAPRAFARASGIARTCRRIAASDQRPVRVPARRAGRRSLRTDLPADRRRRRRRRGAIPDAAAHAARPTARCTTPRKSCPPRNSAGHDPRHRPLGAGTRPRRAAAAPRAEPAGAPVRAAVAAHAGARCVCRLARLGDRGARARRPIAGHRPAPGRCVDPLGDAAPVLRTAGAGRRAVLPQPVRARRRMPIRCSSQLPLGYLRLSARYARVPMAARCAMRCAPRSTARTARACR